MYSSLVVSAPLAFSITRGNGSKRARNPDFGFIWSERPLENTSQRCAPTYHVLSVAPRPLLLRHFSGACNSASSIDRSKKAEPTGERNEFCSALPVNVATIVKIYKPTRLCSQRTASSRRTLKNVGRVTDPTASKTRNVSGVCTPPNRVSSLPQPHEKRRSPSRVIPPEQGVKRQQAGSYSSCTSLPRACSVPKFQLQECRVRLRSYVCTASSPSPRLLPPPLHHFGFLSLTFPALICTAKVRSTDGVLCLVHSKLFGVLQKCDLRFRSAVNARALRVIEAKVCA